MNVGVGVAAAVRVSAGTEVEVAVGGSGLGVADGLPAAATLQAASAANPAINGQRNGLGRYSRTLGIAYRESVG